jgi:hypothetical protein
MSAVHRSCVAWVLVACSSKGVVAVAKDATQPRDRAPIADATPDARVEPLLACRPSLHHLIGKLEVSADPATLRGQLVAYDASTSPSRHLRVRAKPSADETVFVFVDYAESDSTFKGKRVPRTDQLRPGDVVVRLLRSHSDVRLVFDGALRPTPDFDRGSWVDGYSCLGR